MIKRYFSPIILFLSCSIFFYVFFRSEIYYLGEIRYYYYPYYFFSLLLIILSFFSFYINENLKSDILIYLMSGVIAIYIIEGILTFINIQEKLEWRINQIPYKAKVYRENTGKVFDRSSITENYLKETIDKEATLKLSPYHHISTNDELFPLSGISNILTFYKNENGYHSSYVSDRYGFNNPDYEWDAESHEYVLIGDSFTHGCCVNRPDDIGSILRELSNESVINLGYSSNGPLIELATLKEYFPKNTKKLLWIYWEFNDLDDLVNELESKILIKYYDDENFRQNLITKQKEIDNKVSLIISEKLNSMISFHNLKNTNAFKIKKFIKVGTTREAIRISLNYYFSFFQNNFENEQISSDTIKKFEKIIINANNYAKTHNTKMYFIYLPAYVRYVENISIDNLSTIKDLIEDLGIDFIDIHKEVFVKEDNPLKLFPFGLNAHYNELGYRKVASKIFELTR